RRAPACGASRSPSVSAPFPGTEVRGYHPRVTTRIVALKEGQSELYTATAEEIPELLGNPKNIVWVDMWDPGEAEKKLLAGSFDIHPILIEDMIADAPTPKV